MEEKKSQNNSLLFELHQISPSLSQAIITVPHNLIAVIYNQAAQAQQAVVETHGFTRGNVPISYIKQNYHATLKTHVEEFLFKYFVHNFLHKEIRSRKILVSGEPRCSKIELDIDKNGKFFFDMTTLQPIELQEWKYFPFKAPKRKKYKDLDRQVETFINEEKKSKESISDETIRIGDWVNFDITIVNDQRQALFDDHKENLWMKVGDEEADGPLRDIFIGKHTNETFFSSNQLLQEFFSDHLNTHYLFCITIVDIVHNSFFCLENFKKYFKLKTNKELYQKLVEVFSYRNDLSQRRAMVEEALKLLLSKHQPKVPKNSILRQTNAVLNDIQANPDYHVYRIQKDFMERVQELAEKQAMEALIIDQIAYQEHIEATAHDIKTYLNLTKHPRTKEFIYFTLPATKIRGQEVPISAQELKIICTREKTLNHIIYHLTQK